VQERVVERLAARLGGLDRDLEVLLDLLLADLLGQPARPQGELELGLVRLLVRADDAVEVAHHADGSERMFMSQF